MKSKVTTRGQVSIPSIIRREFNIGPESSIEWVIDGEMIKVIPLPKDVIKAFRGRGKGKYSCEKLLRERTKERKLEDET